MGLFSSAGINDARVSGGRAMPLLPGTYTLEVTEVRGGQTRQKHPYYEIVMRVTESTNPAQPVGSTCNQYCQFAGTKYPELAASQAKEITVCMSGLDPRAAGDAQEIAKQNWEEIMELAVTTPKVFIGKKLKCVANAAVSQKSGKEVTYRNYAPVKVEGKK